MPTPIDMDPDQGVCVQGVGSNIELLIVWCLCPVLALRLCMQCVDLPPAGVYLYDAMTYLLHMHTC